MKRETREAKIYKLLKKGYYNEAFLIAEDELNNTYSTPDALLLFYHLLAGLLSNHLGKINNSFERLNSKSHDYLPFNELNSFLILKSNNDYETVLKSYIELSEKYPDNNKIKKILNLLRKTESIEVLQGNLKLRDYVTIPKPAKKFIIIKKDYSVHTRKVSKKYFMIPLLSMLGVGIIAVVILISLNFDFQNKLISRLNVPANHEIIDTINLDNLNYSLINKINNNKTDYFYYTDDELLTDFNVAKSFMKNKKYNDALFILNKIDSSNAQLRVREKNEFLKSFITDQKHRLFEKYPIIDVIKNSVKYNGVAINTVGVVNNYESTSSGIYFDLLVDADKGNTFSAIISCTSEKNENILSLKNGMIVDINGIVNTDLNKKKLVLMCKNINIKQAK